MSERDVSQGERERLAAALMKIANASLENEANDGYVLVLREERASLHRAAALLRSEQPREAPTNAFDAGWMAHGGLPNDQMRSARAVWITAASQLDPAPEPERIEGWRPIESAPKDGTRFLGWCHWESPYEHPPSADFPVLLYWIDHNGGGFVGHFLGTPTHWMPLPAGPAAGPVESDAHLGEQTP